MFKTLVRSLALALCFGLPIAGPANAAVMDGLNSAGPLAVHVAPVELAQYAYGGANYCWYPNGWRGPGWYQCGFAFRTGYGWGGGYGWNGWRGGGYRGGAVVVRGGGYRGGAVYRGGAYRGGAVVRGGGYRGGGVAVRGGGYRGGGGRRR